MFKILEAVKSLYHVKKLQSKSKKYCNIREKIVVRFGNKPMITALLAATMHQRAILASWHVSFSLALFPTLFPFFTHVCNVMLQAIEYPLISKTVREYIVVALEI